MPTVKSILLILLLFGVRPAPAQNSYDSLKTQSQPPVLQKIYLATDKVIYTANEQLWFAAYLFENAGLLKDTADVLTLGLHDPVSHKMVALKKFTLHNRVASGNLLLPDSLVAGEYDLVAYTNLVDGNHIPVGTGFKPLRIYAKTGDKFFTTSLKVIDSLSTEDKIAVLHEIVPETYQVTFKNAKAKYYIAGEKPRTLDLDTYGHGVIYITRKDIKTPDRSLSVTTLYNGDTVKNRIKIPQYHQLQKNVSVSFYPESGILAAGYPNRVFWELILKNTSTSSPALLLENDQVIDTIYTEANAASAFYLNAKAGKQYSVIPGLKDSSSQHFPLPPVTKGGVRFEIPHVIVNDSLTIELWSKEKKTVTLILVDVNDMASFHQLEMGTYKKVSILLQEFPRGLCKLFIIDNDKNLLARSYFFAHYNKRNQLSLQTDKDVYKIRDSVLLNMNVNNNIGIPQNAIATISCVLLSRIDFNKVKNLESDHDLQNTIYNEPVFYKRRNILDTLSLLEHILRTKNIAADDPVFSNYKNKPASFLKPAVQLQLTRYGRPVKKPVDMVLFRDGNVSFLKMNEEGTVKLSNDDLLVKDGRKLFVKGMGKKNGDYYVVTEDSLIKAHQSITIPLYNPVYREQAPDLQALLKTDRTEKFSKTMETIIVKSNRDFGAMGRANPCGDYVCQNNILNCPNHIVPYKWPVKGQQYRSYGSAIITYEGCDYENNMYLPSSSLIHLPRTFLGMDTTLLRQDFPEYLSTLWWQPFKTLSAGSNNNIKFYTSDQTGVYLITVQGFAANGQPFYGEKTIRVED